MDDVLKELQHEPIIEAALEFIPDPDLDALFRQAQATAREHGWNCPTREEFEATFRKEMAGKIQQ